MYQEITHIPRYKFFSKIHSGRTTKKIPTFTLLIIFLIKLLRPLLGPQGVCPFTAGCTEYALIELQTKNIFVALFNITKRLLMCNPIYLYFKR